jgi:hypothetical protein
MYGSSALRLGGDAMEQRPDLKKLSGAQLVVVPEAAGQLHQHRRESLLAAVALSLFGCPDHGDGAVHRAIGAALKDLHAARKVVL